MATRRKRKKSTKRGLTRGGKLRKGCRFVRGGRVVCKSRKTTKRRKRRCAPGCTPTKRRRKGARRRTQSFKGEFKIVSRKLATKSNGRLKKGCRFVRGGRAKCRVA